MNEFVLETPLFTLSVWTRNTDKASGRLQQTFVSRGLAPPCSCVRFSPPVADIAAGSLLAQWDLPQAYFFENSRYEIELVFADAVDLSIEPQLLHPLQRVNEGFRFVKKSRSLRGMLDTGNDVGWLKLPFCFYLKDGRQVMQSLSFEVLPTKMVMQDDLQQIFRQLDSHYPLWRFAFARQTEQHWGNRRKRQPPFLLMWLAQFEQQYADLLRGLTLLLNAPHARLLHNSRWQQADRLKGRLKPKKEEFIRNKLAEGKQQRFEVTQRKLSVDTPENRFIKYLLRYSVKKLEMVAAKAKSLNELPENTLLSAAFFDKLESWRKTIRNLLNRPMFREVGDFQGLNQVSLVLQQKTGYQAVFKVWQEWKLYVDVLGKNTALGTKTVAEIYEVWCLLAMKEIVESLGFMPLKQQRAVMKMPYLDMQLSEGMGAAFGFERSDGIKLRLAHEPVFNRTKNDASINPMNPFFSYTVQQKPDIVLEVEYQGHPKIFWVFDAKYRIDNGNDKDLPPRDAIDQMHRYRDALMMRYAGQTVRPTFGAFVLYPGFFNQESDTNPYAYAIEKAGIGAFALLPDKCHHIWLQQFLYSKLGNNGNYPHNEIHSAHPVQIPYSGH